MQAKTLPPSLAQWSGKNIWPVVNGPSASRVEADRVKRCMGQNTVQSSSDDRPKDDVELDFQAGRTCGVKG